MPIASAQLVQQAIFHHQRGQLAEAEKLYQAVLKRDGRNFAATHGLGLIRLQLGQHADAEPMFRRATRINANSAEAYHHLAVVQTGLGRAEEAVRNFQKALGIKSDFAEAHDSLGHALQLLGQFDEALSRHQKAIALKPGYAAAYNNLGNALQKLGRFDEAVTEYEEALALRPIYPEAHNNLGLAFAKQRRFEEAIPHYEKAIAGRPNYPDALFNLANALAALGRGDEAIPWYQKTLALDPNHCEARTCLGETLFRLDRPEEASIQCDHVLAVEPVTYQALNNVGPLLWKLGRRDEALACYDRALATQPRNLQVLVNRADSLAQVQRYDEALATYADAQAVGPEHSNAQFGEAIVRLILGDFRKGWEKYEWREKSARAFDKPLWRGDEDISGKTILIHAEQGLGDTLQFCRYAELLAARGANVVLQVQPALKSLLTGLAGAQSVIAEGEPLPEFDYHCPIMSLPFAFGTLLETIPARTPYLTVSPELRSKWQSRLGPAAAMRVGLVWSGNADQANDHCRSMPVRHLLPLFSISGIQFVSLHKEVRRRDLEFVASRDDLLHFGEELRDFSDTAGLVAALDLVISVCTSVGHLAGALNKPTWFLLSEPADWRWLLHRHDSPWYPSARLFRQPKFGDWDSVIEEIRAELARLSSLRGSVSGAPSRARSSHA